MDINKGQLEELKQERLRLIKERHRRLILGHGDDEEHDLGVSFDWEDKQDVFDDAVLARELRRQQEEDDF